MWKGTFALDPCKVAQYKNLDAVMAVSKSDAMRLKGHALQSIQIVHYTYMPSSCS